MADTFKIGGKSYTARVVTMADVKFDDLISDGELNRELMLSLSIRNADGSPVDFTSIPIGHTGRMLKHAMEACGFTDDAGDDAGNA
jgi:hypothetical protein